MIGNLEDYSCEDLASFQGGMWSFVPPHHSCLLEFHKILLSPNYNYIHSI